jgi:hypothetical protein
LGFPGGKLKGIFLGGEGRPWGKKINLKKPLLFLGGGFEKKKKNVFFGGKKIFFLWGGLGGRLFFPPFVGKPPREKFFFPRLFYFGKG